MTEITVEPFEPRHLDGFANSHPIGPLPKEQWGKAATFIREREVLAICGIWESDYDGAAEIGLLLSTSATHYPVAMHKLALQMVRGLHRQGHETLRAWAHSDVGTAWLRRLGFSERLAKIDEPALMIGAFEKHA